MIILFSKITGEIFGTVDGRVHDQAQIDSAMIKPDNVPVDEVGKYIVSYKPLTKVEKRMQYKQVLNPDTLEVEQVEAGEVEVEVGAGLELDDQFKELFEKVESGQVAIQRYQMIVNDKGEVQDIVEKPAEPVAEPVKPEPVAPPKSDTSLALKEEVAFMKQQIKDLTKLVEGKKK